VVLTLSWKERSGDTIVSYILSHDVLILLAVTVSQLGCQLHFVLESLSYSASAYGNK